MLTRNVTKEHIQEIFSYFGTIRNIVMPTQGNVDHLSIACTPLYKYISQLTKLSTFITRILIV